MQLSGKRGSSQDSLIKRVCAYVHGCINYLFIINEN